MTRGGSAAGVPTGVEPGGDTGADHGEDPVRLVLRGAKILVGVVYAVFAFYVVLLAIAFVLRLGGADPAAPFAAWIYRASDRIMQPFRGIFPSTQITDRSTFDPSLLFAMVIYALVALALHLLIQWLADRLRARELERSRYGGPPVTRSARASIGQPPSW